MTPLFFFFSFKLAGTVNNLKCSLSEEMIDIPSLCVISQ